MLSKLNKPYPFYDDLAYNFKVILGISLGVFLFFLFFQPIEFQQFDFNNKLLVITGFGGITFIILMLNLVLLPAVFPRIFLSGKWKLYKDLLLNLVIWAMLAVAFNFYSRYVGLVSITFQVSFRIVLLSLIPVIVLVVVHQFGIMKKLLQKMMDPNKEDVDVVHILSDSDKVVEFKSDNQTECFEIPLKDLLVIRSANNYIEVVYSKEGREEKKLVRSTLKKTEEELTMYKNILRCHRTHLVNMDHVHKLGGQPGNLKLVLNNFETDIPVSRQYLENVRSWLNR